MYMYGIIKNEISCINVPCTSALLNHEYLNKNNLEIKLENTIKNNHLICINNIPDDKAHIYFKVLHNFYKQYNKSI